MLGFVRFGLAFLVLISHVGFFLHGKNVGVFAVVVFYLLAGLTVSKVFLKVAPNDMKYFFTDRFLRIYPLYFAVAVLSIIFLFFSIKDLSIYKIFLNLIIIPLNYFHFIDVSVFEAPLGLNFLIPPAWSLGCEIQAYILLIFAIKYKKFGKILALVSLFSFLLAQKGNFDLYGYRLVSGVFFIFYCGYLIGIKEYKFLSLFVFVLFVDFLINFVFFEFKLHESEVKLGFLFGVLILMLHEIYKPKIHFNAFFGSMSYIIFLTHFLGIFIFKHFNIAISILNIFAFSFLLSLVLYILIDKPLNNYRLKR